MLGLMVSFPTKFNHQGLTPPKVNMHNMSLFIETLFCRGMFLFPKIIPQSIKRRKKVTFSKFFPIKTLGLE